MNKILMSLCLFSSALIAEESFPPRKVPERIIPVPTNVSPQLQRNIAQPLDPLMFVEPKTLAEWHEIVAKGEGVVTESLMKSANKLFTVDVKAEEVAGVKTHLVSPKTLAEKNQDKILVYVHGGGYILMVEKAASPKPWPWPRIARYRSSLLTIECFLITHSLLA